MKTESTVTPITQEAVLLHTMKSCKIPDHLQPGILRYVLSGIKPGSFLSAVISNDLMRAICSASDELTVADIRAVCQFLYNDAPPLCHGTAGLMADWMRSKQREAGVTK